MAEVMSAIPSSIDWRRVNASRRSAIASASLNEARLGGMWTMSPRACGGERMPVYQSDDEWRIVVIMKFSPYPPSNL